MIAFLRWFPAYRQVERQLHETSIAREGLQGEVRALRGEVERLREDLQAAHESERTAYRMLINVDYQLRYGFAPYPDAPKLPEGRMPSSNEPILHTEYVNMSRVVDAARAEEREKFRREVLGVQ